MLDLVLWILLPLCVGFAVRISNSKQLHLINESLTIIVYLILLLIGMELAQVENLGRELGFILGVSLLFLTVNIACNIGMVMLLDLKFPLRLQTHKTQANSVKHAILGSLKQIGCVLAGFIAAKLLSGWWLPPHISISIALALLLFLIGVQLRSTGISVKRVFFNRRGVVLSLALVLSSWVASVILYFGLNLFLDKPVLLSQTLAISSGFGWYSLSGIIMTDAYGAVWGSVALVNDLGREFFALMCIPMLMMRYPSTAVGVGGVTSLDFTLPTIQRAGGVAIVPLAISFGFIMNVLSPILMAFFAHAKF